VDIAVMAPKLLACVIPHGITNRNSIKSVYINRIRTVSRLTCPFPEEFKFVVVNPEVPVAIFDQDVSSVSIA